MLIALVAVAACTDDEVQESRDVDFCVRAVWQDGLSGGKTTRALSATSILDDGTEDINIGFDDYPGTIDVKCKKGTSEVLDLTLTKGTTICSEHPEYWSYTPSFLFRDQNIRREDYKFYATAVIDEDGDPATTTDGDRLEGYADKSNIDDTHLKLTLHHTKALLRFAFKVSEKYDKVRYIRITGITLNDEDGVVVDKVLNKDGMTLIGYVYVDPAIVTTTNENTIRCTYNIYDKDAVFPTSAMSEADKTAAETELRNHLTREGVVAQNKFTLGSLKDASNNAVSEIRAGYYYDLKVTLNPDYLYVMSEHDNKHITIE